MTTDTAAGRAARARQTPERRAFSASGRPLRRPVALAIQVGIFLAALLIWQLAPLLPGDSPLTDPFFISSPTRVLEEIGRLWSAGTLLPYLATTVLSSLAGAAIGLVLGAAAGLLLSNSVRLSQIFRPFAVAINAIPRVALIPVMVIMLGPTFQASVVSAIIVVFFVAFFNAYEGGMSVPLSLVQNAYLLGASRSAVMRTIRLPFVLAWTFAALPLAITFGLITVVTTEILTGVKGMGRMITDSLSLAQASLTFAAVAVLSVVGLVIVLLAEAVKRRVLHWWINSDLASARG